MSNLIMNINDIYLERIWVRMCYKDIKNSAFSKLIFTVEILNEYPPFIPGRNFTLNLWGTPPLFMSPLYSGCRGRICIKNVHPLLSSTNLVGEFTFLNQM